MTALTRSSFPPLLRFALVVDAGASAATGLLLVLGSSRLHEWLGLPAPLMQYAGLSLLPFAALVAYVATRREPMRAITRAIIAYNALWAIDSIVLLASGSLAPTMLGAAFVIAQALAVGGLAALQCAGLRQTA